MLEKEEGVDIKPLMVEISILKIIIKNTIAMQEK